MEGIMSLHPHAIDPIPEQTARIARAAFRRGNSFMRMRDEIGTLFTDEAFAPVFPARGRPVVSPWRLALVCVMQYVESLSDRQAAEAVRARIDWKYSLSLALDDPGFDASVLSEFRTRLVSGGLEEQMLDLMLEHFRAHKLLKARGKQRTDSTHVLAAIRAVNRLECVGETMRAALNCLAVAAPDWLRAHSDPEWIDRYGPRIDDARLPEKPAARRELAQTIAADGYRLMAAIYAPDAPDWLREVPAVQTLRRVWIERFLRVDEQVEERGDASGRPPSAGMISSPYDPDARYATKRTTSWTGYKVHLSETCDDDMPRLITHVETAPGPAADGDATPTIHHALAAKDLLPELHIVDTGYLDAELLLASRDDYKVELLGPTRRDQRWQARAKEGFGMAAFAIDWERQRAICPRGCASIQWDERTDVRGNASIYIRFAKTDCVPCPCHSQCTKAPRRSIAIRPRAQYEALQGRRAEQETEGFAAEYARRAGIEGTISQGVRAFGLRRAKYIGAAKTHLQHILTAAAIDFVRVAAWLDDVPLAGTRRSSFVTLMQPQPAAA
jgi:transposase